MRLTNNFSKEEFDSKDGSEMTQEVFMNVQELAKNLQVLRDEIKRPIKINSGYRSPSHNAKVKGAIRSQHLLGTAADIVVNGKTSTQVAALIEQLIAQGKMKEGGLKAYKSFTHYDIRGKNIRW